MNSRCCIALTKSFRRFLGGPACRSLRLMIVGVLTLGILSTASLGLALAQPSTASTQQTAALEKKTQRLAALLARYQLADENEQAQLEDELVNLASDRKQVLLSFIEDSPGKVLRQALPEKLLKDVPDKVRAQLEQHVELEGALEVFYEDYEDNTSRLRYSLKANGKRFTLHFTDRPPALLHGTKVGIRGVAMEDSLALTSDETGLQILALGDDNTVESSSASAVETLPNTFGEQKTLVLLVNYQDNPEEKPWSLQEANDLIFGTVSDFFSENSFGQTWLTGDVYGWFTMPIESSNCNNGDIAQAAQETAINAGIQLSDYQRYIYVLPDTPCLPSGIGSVGGTPSESWIHGNNFVLKVVGHELGHNLGLYHSNCLECGDTTLGSDCTTFPYGDTWDIMGNSFAAHFNTFQKERLGWLDSSQGGVVNADADGIYTLDTYENDISTLPKGLKIVQYTSPETGNQTLYYVEHRQAIGFDDFLTDNTNVLNGVLIHRATPTSPTSSVLLDMTPGSKTWDWGDPALVAGQTFTDPENGLSLSVLQANNGTVDIEVIYGAPACMRANPTIIVSPVEPEWVAPGTPVTYTVSVTNNDSTACSGVNFEMSVSAPTTEWTALYGSETLFLDPGDTAATTLEVTSPLSSADGFYSIDIMGQNSVDQNNSTNASLTYVVSQTSGNTTPIAVDDSAVTLQKVPVLIDVLGNDHDPDGNALTVAQVTNGSLGSVSLDSDSNVIYSPIRNSQGEDSFTYIVTDGMDSASATVHVTINKSISAGKKKK